MSLFMQPSASPLCLIIPPKASVFFLPLILPFSSTYGIEIRYKKGLTYVSDFNLDGGVVVGCDEVVGGGAFSWDVQVHNFVFVVLHF